MNFDYATDNGPSCQNCAAGGIYTYTMSGDGWYSSRCQCCGSRYRFASCAATAAGVRSDHEQARAVDHRWQAKHAAMVADLAPGAATHVVMGARFGREAETFADNCAAMGYAVTAHRAGSGNAEHTGRFTNCYVVALTVKAPKVGAENE